MIGYNALDQKLIDKRIQPCEVTTETDISSVNLNWSERELPERERTKHVHRLHPYLGKYIPQLVEILLRKYFKRGQTVLDPFCGSGTTLVQANELGINAIGYDISKFNILLSKVKTTKYNLQIMQEEVFDILDRLQKITQSNNNQGSLWEEKNVKFILIDSDENYLKKWYDKQALSELLAYRHFIETSDYYYKDLLKIILTRAARSARLTTHFNLDFPKVPQVEPYWCYKHSRTCTPTKEAYKFLRRYSIDTVRRIKEFSKIQTDAGIELKHVDSRTVSSQLIDGIVTSPPYLGLIDYHEQHAYAYSLLGLEDKSELEVGPAKNGAKENAQKKYVEDISRIIQNVSKKMNSQGKIIIVANDKLNLYDEIIERANLEIEDIIHRHVNRRTGMRKNNFYESIFILIKKG